MRKLLQLAWAAPASAVGLALAPFFDRHYVSRGVLLCEGAAWPRRLGWRYRAIAFGHVVLATNELEPEVMDHELVHVRQYERWGLFLFPAYASAGAFVRLRGGHHHRDNPFEKAARRQARKEGARTALGGGDARPLTPTGSD